MNQLRIAAEKKKLDELKTVTPLATLLELSEGQISRYHNIATGQADRSFLSSQLAMGVGMALIGVCFVVGLLAPTADAKIFVGSVAALGGALAAFLNRTYLQMYRQTLDQLNRYFEQPVINGYYLTAERLAMDLDEARAAEMRIRIIGQVLDGSVRVVNGTTSRKRRTDGKNTKKKADITANLNGQVGGSEDREGQTE